MTETLIMKIRDRYSELTPQHQQLADYLMKNSEEAAFLSVEELARMANVSTATVVRFAQTLGYNGFGGIRQYLQEQLIARERETPLDRLTLTLKRIQDNEIEVRSFSEDIANLEATINEFSPQVFQRAVEKITGARKIYLVGFGSCQALTYFLHFHLNRLAFETELVTSGGTQLLEKLAYIEPNDVLFVISFPRYSRDSLRALEHARKNGIQTVLLTDKLQSPLIKSADEVLLAKCKTTGFLNSFVGAMSICNLLVLMAGLKDHKRSLDSLKKLELIKADPDLYV